MGDILQIIPFLHKTKRLFPDCNITLAVPNQFKKTTDFLPYVDKTIPIDEDLIRKKISECKDWIEAYKVTNNFLELFRKNNFDIAYNFVYSENGAITLKLLDIPKIHGLKLEGYNLFSLTDPWFIYLYNFYSFIEFNPFNITDIFRHCGNIDPYFPENKIKYPSYDILSEPIKKILESSKNIIAIQPGSNSPDRRIAPDTYSKTAQLLADNNDLKILILGAPNEKELLKKIIDSTNSPNIIETVCSLDELTIILKYCKLLITNDTGPMHIAAASGTKILLLSCGTSNPNISGPYLKGSYALTPKTKCFPCKPSEVCTEMTCHSALSFEEIYNVSKWIIDGENPDNSPVISNSNFIEFKRDTNAFLRVKKLNTENTDTDIYKEIWAYFWKWITNTNKQIIQEDEDVYSFKFPNKLRERISVFLNEINILSNTLSYGIEVFRNTLDNLEHTTNLTTDNFTKVKEILNTINIQIINSNTTCPQTKPYTIMLNHMLNNIFHDSPIDMIREQIDLFSTYNSGFEYIKKIAT